MSLPFQWPNYGRDIAAWKRVESAVFDPRFESFIFDALGIKTKAARKEIRIQLDEAGFSIGGEAAMREDEKKRRGVTHLTTTRSRFSFRACVHTNEYTFRSLKQLERERRSKDNNLGCVLIETWFASLVPTLKAFVIKK